MAAYQSRHSAPAEQKPKSKLPLIIILTLVGICVLGAAVYALVHFVILAPPAEQPAPTAPPAAPTLAPVPTEAPTEAPTEPDYLLMAENKMAAMSDREKICQLFIVTPEALTGVDGVTMAGDTTKNAIENYPVGGIIYFGDNIETAEQISEMIEKSQGYAEIPMFIAVDEEGGDVSRVASKLGTASFDPMYTYKAQGTQVARDNAKAIASSIKELGFNLDLAPVADVWTNPDNTVIGSRAYSDSYEDAAQLVANAVQGFADGGVLSTLKHFPGHGNTSEDSHESLAYVGSSADELKNGELLPFKSGIEAGADMVMVGHLVVSEIDPDMPATLSSKVVPQLLREYLGYDGLVISDSMQMASITANYDHDTIVKGLFNADVDVILQPDDIEAYITAIENALENGDITRQQIDAKVKKILALKFKKGIIQNPCALLTAQPTEAPTEDYTLSEEDIQAIDAALNDETEVTDP